MIEHRWYERPASDGGWWMMVDGVTHGLPFLPLALGPMYLIFHEWPSLTILASVNYCLIVPCLVVHRMWYRATNKDALALKDVTSCVDFC